jgi:FeS assembly protein IscX
MSLSFEERGMAEKLTWDDTHKIGVLLARKHPELCPEAATFEDLHRYVLALPEFKGDSAIFDKQKLEAIQEAWNMEFLDRTQ